MSGRTIVRPDKEKDNLPVFRGMKRLPRLPLGSSPSGNSGEEKPSCHITTAAQMVCWAISFLTIAISPCWAHRAWRRRSAPRRQLRSPWVCMGMPGVALEDYPLAKCIIIWGANPKATNSSAAASQEERRVHRGGQSRADIFPSRD